MLKTAICDLFGIRYPIIQGGMTHLATAELVSAVSGSGGLGIIAAGNYEPEWLRRQILLTRRSTDQPFGVNLYLRSPRLKEQIRVLIEEHIKIVFTGAGNPADVLSVFSANKITTAVVVGDVSSAIKAEKLAADAVVAEGMEAGGHIGEVPIRTLVKQVRQAIKIPVIAAGGIADGNGLAEMLKLGAQGVQMGTRFICSEECPAHTAFKKAIISSVPADTVVLGQSGVTRIRCLANRFTQQYQELEKAGASAVELQMFSAGRLYKGMIEGDIEEGCLMAGQSVGKMNRILPVKQIILDIMKEAEKAVRESKER